MPAPNDVVVAVIVLVADCVTAPAEPVVVLRLVAWTSSSAMPSVVALPTVTDTALPVAPKLPIVLPWAAPVLPTVMLSVAAAVMATAPATCRPVLAACETAPDAPPVVLMVRSCVLMSPSTRSCGLLTCTKAPLPVVVADSFVMLLVWVSSATVASVPLSTMLVPTVVVIRPPVCVMLPAAVRLKLVPVTAARSTAPGAT